MGCVWGCVGGAGASNLMGISWATVGWSLDPPEHCEILSPCASMESSSEVPLMADPPECLRSLHGPAGAPLRPMVAKCGAWDILAARSLMSWSSDTQAGTRKPCCGWRPLSDPSSPSSAFVNMASGVKKQSLKNMSSPLDSPSFNPRKMSSPDLRALGEKCLSRKRFSPLGNLGRSRYRSGKASGSIGDPLKAG